MNWQQKKLKILILTSSYPAPAQDLRSSFGVFVRDFVNELSKSANVSVITQYNISRKSSDTTENGVRVVRFSWAGKDKDLADLKPLRDFFYIFSALLNGARTVFQFAKNEKIDFIFSAWVIPGGFWALPAKWFLKTQFGVWALGSDIWDYGKKPIIKNIITVILNNSKIQYADGYKLLAEMNQLSRNKGQFLSTTRLLPKGTPPPPRKLNPSKTYLLFIGRYHKNKGIDLLLESIHLLEINIRESIHFHIYGGGPLEETLKRIIAKNNLGDCVTLNGYADELTALAYLKNCDGIIIPSRIESIPVVLSDALQSECPLIVSNVGDMGKLVSEYQAGMVITDINPLGISKIISSFITEDMGKYKSGAENLRQLFDIKMNTQLLLENIKGSL